MNIKFMYVTVGEFNRTPVNSLSLLKDFHGFNTHVDSRFKPSPASRHQKSPQEEDILTVFICILASNLWDTSAPALSGIRSTVVGKSVCVLVDVW